MLLAVIVVMVRAGVVEVEDIVPVAASVVIHRGRKAGIQGFLIK